MKHILTSPGAIILSVCVLLTAMVWWIFPGIKSSALIVFLVFFGLANISILGASMDKSKYRSVIFPRLLPFGSLIAFTNLLLAGAASTFLIFAIYKDSILVLVQIPFWIFAAPVVALTCFWYIAESTLTPKQGTMVVDEKNDAFYLPGEVLPRFLSQRIIIITKDTVIPITVPYVLDGIHGTLAQSFCIAAEVFKRDAFPAIFRYSTILREAEAELREAASKRKTLAEVIQYVPRNSSPYRWNYDLVVSFGECHENLTVKKI